MRRQKRERFLGKLVFNAILTFAAEFFSGNPILRAVVGVIAFVA